MSHENTKHLYLIDGHALAYRSYFGMIRTPLSNAAGQPTGAVYGFAVTLLKLLQDRQCPYIAVVFDSDKPTFRKEMYEEYKANRAAMPDEMRSQIPLIFRLVDALNLPQLRRDGVEADDIIAHLAAKGESEGFEVSIISKDKDLMQLVSDRVHLLSPESGGGLTFMGPREVEEKMGVAPAKIRDLLALMGDSSDNVPGLPGVGPKTAVKLLEEAGSLERILADPDGLKNAKMSAKVKEHFEKLELSRDLVTLKPDLEPAVEIGSLVARPVNREASVAFLKEMEFTSLLKNPMFDSRGKTFFSVHVPRSIDELAEVVERIRAAGQVSIDTETTSTEPRGAQLVGISLAVEDNEAWYVPVGHRTPVANGIVSEARPDLFDTVTAPLEGSVAVPTGPAAANLPLRETLETLREVIESPKIAKIGQNLKYDWQIFRNYDLTLSGIAFDTMIAAYLIDPGKRQYGMDALAARYLDLKTIPIEDLIGKKGKGRGSFADVEVDKAAEYSGEDAVIPLKLTAVMKPVLEKRGLIGLFDEVEMPLVTALAEMEWQGVMIDPSLLSELSREYTDKLVQVSASIYDLAGEEFNLNSPKQIADLFFGKLGMPRSKKTKTGLSTDVDTLEKLAPEYPVAAALLKYREAQKLLSTYIDALPAQVSPTTGRVHSSFNQTIAATGRLSSTNPNLQNIPVRTEEGRRIREAFVAPEGYRIVSADYSQIELRILAHISADDRLIEAFEQDRDIHTQTASAVYGVFAEMVSDDMRRAAKTINFGLMYGMGPINLARQLGISFKEARRFIDAYFEQFPTIRASMDRAIEFAREHGYSETLLGRRRYLPDINAQARQVREAAERTAINTPVQGTAADIIKIAMVSIQEGLSELFSGVRPLMQVHDELVFEAPANDAERFASWVGDKMSAAYTLKVPLKVDVGIGRNWSEAH